MFSWELVLEHQLTYLAITLRVVAFLLFVPVFGGERVPPTLKVALALVIAIVVLPLASENPVTAGAPLELGVLFGKEFLVGATLGFMVKLLFMLARIFGRVADLELGFGLAHTIDPQYGAVPLTGQLLYYTVLIIWLAQNGHHDLLRGIVHSFGVVPLEGAVFRTGLSTQLVDVFAQLFTAALRIGLPFLVPVFLATVTMGILARAMPQLNLLIVGIPLKLLCGFVILTLTLPVIVTGFVRVTGRMNDELLRVLLLLR